ncbi:MAG: DUF2167 domain-containing protein [Hyphomonadaceae bacterium]|nr:DUF2167 domain-containing protein [Hyphomonadaceae bacterium]
MFRTIAATLATACLTAGLMLAGPAAADGPGPATPKGVERPATPLPPGSVTKDDGTTVLPDGATAPPETVGTNGDIPLANGALRLFVPANYYFMPAPEARAHLQRINAPTPAGEVLGMIAPANSRPLDDAFWGAVISLNPLGYVAEQRSDRFSAPDFPDEVRAARPAPAPRLESFAVVPSHDPVRHATSWTERYPAPNPVARSVRAEQRILGRDAVAGVTIDGRPDQIATITAALPEIGRMVTFAPGKKYTDYVAGTDPASAYDLPSLLTLKARPGAVAPPVQAAAEPGTAPQSALNLEGLTKWLPWAGAGLLVLALIPWLVGRSRRRKEDEADRNLVPPDDKEKKD